MTTSTTDSAPGYAGYDGWAVIDLATHAVVRADARGVEMLGIDHADLPVPLADLLTSTDYSAMSKQAIPRLQAGSQWRGGLRLGHQRVDNQRVDAAPSPVVCVPHVSADRSSVPLQASLLLAVSPVKDATAIVPDPLTGLPTRSALFQRLEGAVRRNRDNDALLVAMFLDLDGLKLVNDRYGHDVGDTSLIETAQRIVACLPSGALAARFGGDEFVVILETATDLDAARGLADEILAALHEVRDYHAISASIGLSYSHSGEVEAHELIRRADSAMYRAKAQGGSRVAIFDAEMRSRQRNDKALRASLLKAIATNGLGVAAQPLFELATGQVLGVELFIRIHDDTPYIANANQLFRIAHEYGEAFDAAVLGRGLAVAKAWRDAYGRSAPRLQINVSAQSLAASEFAGRVSRAFAQHGAALGTIAFEVDGRDLGVAGEREHGTIAALRAQHVPVIVDGFGDNAVTVQTLADLGPAMVKIDAAGRSPQVLAALVRSVSALGIPTCVKGIGEAQQLGAAVAIGAYAGQGNALSPVQKVERITDLLNSPQRLGF